MAAAAGAEEDQPTGAETGWNCQLQAGFGHASARMKGPCRGMSPFKCTPGQTEKSERLRQRILPLHRPGQAPRALASSSGTLYIAHTAWQHLLVSFLGHVQTGSSAWARLMSVVTLHLALLFIIMQRHAVNVRGMSRRVESP